MTSLTVHASCVAFGNKAVLVRGKPGGGKSDLVLRLIDGQGFGLGDTLLRARLVADDQTILFREKDVVIASPPKILAGKLEIRGWGIISVSYKPKAMLRLVIDLRPKAEITRMPEPADLTTTILGLEFPLFYVDPTTPSATARIRSFLTEMHFT